MECLRLEKKAVGLLETLWTTRPKTRRHVLENLNVRKGFEVNRNWRLWIQCNQHSQHHHVHLDGVTIYTAYQLATQYSATSTHNSINILYLNIDLKLLFKTILFTYSMVQSPSWETNWFAASQEFPRISRNPKVHYRTHKPPPTVPILGQPNPVHIPTSNLLEIHPNIMYPSTPRSPLWSLSLYTPLSSPIRATFPAHLILFYFVTRSLLGEEYKSFIFSLCNLLHSPVTSSLLGPNILLNTMFSNILSFLSSRNINDPYKTTDKIVLLYILIFKFLDRNLEDKRFCTEW